MIIWFAFRSLKKTMGFPDSSVDEKIHLQCRRPWFDSWVGKMPWRRDTLPTPVFLGFRGGSDDKKFYCNLGDLGLIPRLRRSPGGGHGNPLQYSCLENPYGQRSLVGYSPCGGKELDLTELLCSKVLGEAHMVVVNTKKKNCG